MAYSNESFRRVKNRMEERRGRAMSEAEARRAEVWAKCPALEEIDGELANRWVLDEVTEIKGNYLYVSQSGQGGLCEFVK